MNGIIHFMTVLLEYMDSFAAICHKHIGSVINVFTYFLLCRHYA